jgi:hypothetical protein
VSNIDHGLGDPEWQIVAMPLREFQPDPGPRRYGIAHLVEKRRDILRFARSLPPGPRRNQLRQAAASLRALAGDAGWLDAHTLVISDRPNGAAEL